MIGPNFDVPDLLEEVIGFRHFILRQTGHDYALFSPYAQEQWRTAERKAQCNKPVPVAADSKIVLPREPERHSAPAKGCECGLYAYFDPKPIQKPHHDEWKYGAIQRYEPNVLALVALSGRIEVHSDGMRAARLRICALGSNTTRLSEMELLGLKQVAEQLGVPIHPQDELIAIASEYGTVLPDEMRPALPKPRGGCNVAAVPAAPPVPSERAEQKGLAGTAVWQGAGNAVLSVIFWLGFGFIPWVNLSVVAASVAYLAFRGARA